MTTMPTPPTDPELSPWPGTTARPPAQPQTSTPPPNAPFLSPNASATSLAPTHRRKSKKAPAAKSEAPQASSSTTTPAAENQRAYTVDVVGMDGQVKYTVEVPFMVEPESAPTPEPPTALEPRQEAQQLQRFLVNQAIKAGVPRGQIPQKVAQMLSGEIPPLIAPPPHEEPKLVAELPASFRDEIVDPTVTRQALVEDLDRAVENADRTVRKTMKSLAAYDADPPPPPVERMEHDLTNMTELATRSARRGLLYARLYRVTFVLMIGFVVNTMLRGFVRSQFPAYFDDFLTMDYFAMIVIGVFYGLWMMGMRRQIRREKVL